MKETPKKLQVIKNIASSLMLWLTLLGFSFLITFFILIQFSAIQTKFSIWAVEKISTNINHRMDIGEVKIQWLDEILLQDIRIYDQYDSLMISVPSVFVDFNVFSAIFQHEGLYLDAVQIISPKVHLIKHADNTDLNINTFINSFSKKEKKKKANTVLFTSKRVKLENGHFSYNNQTKDSIFNQLDYNHFGITKLTGNFSDFRLDGSELSLNIDKLTGKEAQEYIHINELKGAFHFTSTSLTLDKFDLKTENSHLSDRIVLKYAKPSNLSYFIDSVDFEVNFDFANIGTKDIRAFVPKYNTVEDVFQIKGLLQGKINRMYADKITIRVGQSSFVTGKLALSGLPSINETFMELKLSDGYIVPQDIKPYINQNYDMVQGVGAVALEGAFMGFVTDFVANAKFRTRTGFVTSDINIKIPEDFKETEYKGQLKLENFDLGSVLNNEVFQRISMQGNLQGSGLTLENANFFMDATISKVGINHYNYKNITTLGQFASEFFEGRFTVDDPNLKISAIGTADFRPGYERMLANIQLDSANLLSLNLSEVPFSLASNVFIDVEKFQIDSLTGQIIIKETELAINQEKVKIDSIHILSTLTENIRSLSVVSDVLELQTYGSFTFTNLVKDFTMLYHEYKLDLENNSEEIETYYAKKIKSTPEEYDLKMELTLLNINHIIHLFKDDIVLGDETVFYGSFRHGQTSLISLYAKPDTFKIGKNTFLKNEIDINISKLADSTSVLGMMFLASENQQWSTISSTKNSFIEAVWNGRHVDVSANFEQADLDNFARITGNIDFLKDTTVVTLNPSYMRAFTKNWQFSEKNQLLFTQGEVFIDDLKLFTDEEFIFVNGVISDSTHKETSIEVSNFNLYNLYPFTQLDLSGNVDGTATIKNPYGAKSIESDFAVRNFYIEKFLVGNLKSISHWENENKRFQLALDVTRNSKKVIDIAGYFSPSDTSGQLSMEAKLNDARLNIAEPFLKNLFTNLDGKVNGDFIISGDLNQPIISGVGAVSEGQLHVNYLHTDYKFDGNIEFTADKIGFRQIALLDDDGNKAEVNGSIFHQGFKDFRLDLAGKMNGLKVLNTTTIDNELYYGTAYAIGDISMTGSFSNININATARSARGTRIFIPISSTTTIEQEDFISFVSFSKKDATTEYSEQKANITNLSGIKLNFDLEITPEAYCELIFDIKSGDIIRGRGNGNLKLQIDTNGEFNMFGDFEIQSGAYNFTLYNIINKEFTIEEGSTISWYGNPYEASLNINANYRQLASLTPLMTTLDEETLTAPELRRKYPALVALKLEGEMLSPNISFDIDFVDYPDNIMLQNGTLIALNALVSSFKNRILADEQELKRQVFSLIILRRLSPENSFTVSGGQTIGSSVSEFVSNQLSYWITQVDENLEIDVDLNSLDGDALNTFQLRLAYTFFDGRLRISRGGGFTNLATNQSDFNSILGDWSLEYLLTSDGKLRAKMFNRIDQNSFMALNNNTHETGFSLQYIRSFDQLSGIIRDARRKKLMEEAESKENESGEEVSEKIVSNPQ